MLPIFCTVWEQMTQPSHIFSDFPDSSLWWFKEAVDHIRIIDIGLELACNAGGSIGEYHWIGINSLCIWKDSPHLPQPVQNREYQYVIQLKSKSKKGRGALDESFLDCSLHAETKTQDLSDICVILRFTVVPRYWPLLRWLVCARHSCPRGFPSNRRALVRELLARWTGETGNHSPPCI